MKERVKIALLQVHIHGNPLDSSVKENNIVHALEMIATAAQSSPDLIVMPNEWVAGSGYGPLNMVDFRHEGGFERLQEAVKLAGCWVAGGVMDPPRENFDGFRSYMMGYLINPEGEIVAEHPAMHVVKGARPWSLPGGFPKVVETDFGRVGLVLDEDLYYPEIARKLALEGVEIIINPALMIDQVDGYQDTDYGLAHFSRQDAWTTCGKARAYENQVFVLGCCPVGVYPPTMNDDYMCVGSSFVAGPSGLIHQCGQEEEIFFCELDGNDLITARRLVNWFEARSELLDQ